MSDITIDLTNYKERQSARLPEGDYRVQVEDIEVGKTGPNSKSPGSTMLTVWYRVLDGEQRGKELIDRLTLTDTAMFRVVAFMQAIGLATPKKKFRVNPSAWVGRALVVTVADGKPYQDEVRSEIKAYSRAPKSESGESTDLEDLMDDSEAAEEQPAAVTAEKAPKAKPEDTADSVDDLPELEDIEL